MDHHETAYEQVADEALRWLRQEPALECLPTDAQKEIRAEVLGKVFLRKISGGIEFNRAYLSCLLRYQMRPARLCDPFVAKARRRAEERARWGLQTDESSLAMIRRSFPKEPIDDLIETEDCEIGKRQLQAIEREVENLDSRAQAVMRKFLSGEELTQSERCVQHRTVQKLRHSLNHHN